MNMSLDMSKGTRTVYPCRVIKKIFRILCRLNGSKAQLPKRYDNKHINLDSSQLVNNINKVYAYVLFIYDL